MSEITTIGLDLAMSVFQVHGINEGGGEVTRKRLRHGQILTFFAGLPPCLVGIEACATAHYWVATVELWLHKGQESAGSPAISSKARRKAVG
jgi:transposase